jgi:DNA-binding CsgD family transcriptional regulator
MFSEIQQMQARAHTSPMPRPASPERYFEHRRATGPAVEMLVSAELDMLWFSAAALSQSTSKKPFTFSADRLILAGRADEERLRTFLTSLDQAPGVWALQAEDDLWLVHAETITPPETARAWLLTWRDTAAHGAHPWADIGVALKLTPAETRVLHLLLDGLSVDDAARSLSVTVETARTHIRRIYAKTGATNRGQLFAIALPYRWG